MHACEGVSMSSIIRGGYALRDVLMVRVHDVQEVEHAKDVDMLERQGLETTGTRRS
jgi:hypothetical protein